MQSIPQAKQEAQVTINERLNKVCEGLHYQCERVEAVMGRVHGSGTANKPSEVAQIKPTLPLGTVVEHLEAVLGRLQDLATGVEKIA